MFHKIQEWTRQIDAVTAEFQEAFGSVGADILNQQPDKNQWSVAQNIDHLIVAPPV